MTAETETGNSESVKAQSRGRYSHKSAGRAEFMRRLNAEGRGGIGGRRPTHGQRALVELFKRGMDEGSPIAQLRREAAEAYVADKGGAGETSVKRKKIIQRMVRLDLNLALLDTQLDKATGLPWKKQNACVKALGGPDRRQKPADREIIIKRWDTPKPDNGSEPENAS